jgi:hypothetical protein
MFKISQGANRYVTQRRGAWETSDRGKTSRLDSALGVGEMGEGCATLFFFFFFLFLIPSLQPSGLPLLPSTVPASHFGAAMNTWPDRSDVHEWVRAT